MNDIQKSLTLNPATIVAELQKMKAQIEAALPRHITPDRMARVALTACRQNPKLYRSTRESFFGALITASQLGLEPGVLGQSYFVPYKNREGNYICTFIPGWRGYMDLLSRTGRAIAWTGAVYEDDEFDYEYGSQPLVHHRPGKSHGQKGRLRYAYAIGRVKGMEESPVIEVWDIDKIEKHRDSNNRVGEDHYSFVHPEMYARKVPLMQVIKYMPMSVELADASALDVDGSEGRQRLTIEGAFNKDYGKEESDEWTQIEFLMERLDWDEDKRKMVRGSYAERPEQLLAILRKEAGPMDAGTKAAPVQAPRSSQFDKEIESLCAQLNINTAQQALLKQAPAYAGHPEELVKYLREVKQQRERMQAAQVVTKAEPKPEPQPEPAAPAEPEPVAAPLRWEEVGQGPPQTTMEPSQRQARGRRGRPTNAELARKEAAEQGLLRPDEEQEESEAAARQRAEQVVDDTLFQL